MKDFIVLNATDRNFRDEYVVNPIYARHGEARRLKGRYHQNGTCGGIHGLCHTCHKWQEEWHLTIAREIGREYPRQPDENPYKYWDRIGGRYLDSWPEAAREAGRAAYGMISIQGR